MVTYSREVLAADGGAGVLAMPEATGARPVKPRRAVHTFKWRTAVSSPLDPRAPQLIDFIG